MASFRTAVGSRAVPLSTSTFPSIFSPCQQRYYSVTTRRLMATEAVAKKEGDISSVFRSLSDGPEEALPARYAEVKRKLLTNKDELHASWVRLLARLKEETAIIRAQGNKVIPEIDFSNLGSPSANFNETFRKRGVAVVRGVVPQTDAREYKQEIEAYVKANPHTKAFPPHDPQVFELYWSRPQLRARAHPNIIETQQWLMQYWHASDANAEISPTHPIAYADRLRIRQPGDSGFALGPHVDSGSVERWEEEGYGKSHVYDKIFQGKWEEYDPWDSSTRINAVSDLYTGAGACSMLRMFQGWLSMSNTAPGEGTLLVNPLLSLSTAYFLLRPFFAPVQTAESTSDVVGEYSPEFLNAKNWIFEKEVSRVLQGASPGHSQELNNVLHPHLDLQHSMVHVPKISPGDYVAWHCDTIHAVDKKHEGATDSSVIYIPACPATKPTLDYLVRQRESFIKGIPPPDFPGGTGESEHTGRPTSSYLEKHAKEDGLRAFGMKPFEVDETARAGERGVLQYANQVLGF